MNYPALLLPFLLVAPAASQNLVAHFQLDETSGILCADSSGSNNNGTYLAMIQLGQPGATGTTGNAVVLDGVDDTVEIPAQANLAGLRDDFTISAWARNDFLDGYRVLFGNQSGWALGTFYGNLRFTTRGVMDFIFQAPGVSTGNWFHYAVTFDASHMATFYVDGVNVGAVQGSAPANAPQPNWYIGTLEGVTEAWTGSIDDIQIYDEVLDSAQIMTLYNSPGSTIGADLGTRYCTPGAPNTTGSPGEQYVTGSLTASLNNVILEARNLPQNQFGIFITSQVQAFIPTPGGSQGNLCLGGQIGRYNGPGQVLNSGSTGTFALVLDLAATPTPTGPTTITAGQTWNFQAWYRDFTGGMAVSNFTDGVSVNFL